MPWDLTGRRVAIVGGDRRELEVAEILSQRGAAVRAVGLPWPDEVSAIDHGLGDTLAWADIIVLPVGGTDELGRVLYSIGHSDDPPRLTEEILRRVHPGALVFIGRAQPYLRDWAERYELHLLEFRERDDFATLNSIPSAEGAIQMAMERTDITLHGANSLVLGFGRTAQTLARMLKGIGAFTTVVARRAEILARVLESGYRPVRVADLREEMPEAEIIFNTIPALVLREDVLQRARRDVVIIDLATSPGGTDFLAAKRLGLQATLAPGLPGIVAPRSAGRIMAEVLLTLIDEIEGG